MKAVSGIPASSASEKLCSRMQGRSPTAQRTLDGYFDLSKINGAKEFIIAPRDMGRMIYDFEEYDTQDEKDAMWGGY